MSDMKKNIKLRSTRKDVGSREWGVGSGNCRSNYRGTTWKHNNSPYNNPTPYSLLPIPFLVLLLCTGCVSLMDKAGQVLDGSAFAEKKTAVYRTADIEMREMRNRAGERSVLISLKQFPTMKIRGSAPDERGEFQLVSMDYLGGSPHGWNEFRLDLSGSGNLVLGDTTAALSVFEEVETVGISSGRIRRYDTRITGTEALTNLRNRHERILALAEWINSSENPLAAPAPLNNQKKFVQYWKPLLFPEMTKKKKQPKDWRQEGDQWARAEDIRWNTSYTERVFPELLRNIRNSGTMLRDWEEALDWLYIECEWTRITETLSGETVLQRKKR